MLLSIDEYGVQRYPTPITYVYNRPRNRRQTAQNIKSLHISELST
jgi:hypothetical protein